MTAASSRAAASDGGRSLPLDRVLIEIRALVAHGYREVVLSGINLGRWGHDLKTHDLKTNDLAGAESFEALIRAVLAETSL